MSTAINSIGRIGGAGAISDTRWRELRPSQGAGFGEVLGKALGQVESLRAEANDAINAFVRGEPVELHQVMAAAEEAGLALELLVEMRNKLTDAYRTVMNMQS